jgi:hypothetical protein
MNEPHTGEFPHRWEALICSRCGGDGVLLTQHSDCPAAMRDRIRELEAHVGSLHRAKADGYAEGLTESRARVDAVNAAIRSIVDLACPPTTPADEPVFCTTREGRPVTVTAGEWREACARFDGRELEYLALLVRTAARASLSRQGAADEERAAIVAWLHLAHRGAIRDARTARKDSVRQRGEDAADVYKDAADAIERGAHMEPSDG